MIVSRGKETSSTYECWKFCRFPSRPTPASVRALSPTSTFSSGPRRTTTACSSFPESSLAALQISGLAAAVHLSYLHRHPPIHVTTYLPSRSARDTSISELPDPRVAALAHRPRPLRRRAHQRRTDQHERRRRPPHLRIIVLNTLFSKFMI